MTTMTLTPRPSTRSVILSIDPSSTVTAVLRSDANGARAVRTQAGRLPASAPFVMEDSEAALTGPISYTVIETTGWGSPASGVTALDLPASVFEVTMAMAPVLSATPHLVTGYTASRTSHTTLHEVIGRADPVASVGPLGTRTGTLTLFCTGYDAARVVERVYSRSQVVLLRQAAYAGMDMYHVTTQVTMEPESIETDRWRVSVDYTEVAYPPGDQIGTLGWSIDDLTATGLRVSGVPLVYPTVADLTLGPVGA